MALTVLTTINRVMSRLNEGDSPANRVFPADIEPLIPDSLKKFAQMVAASSPEVRQLLRKDFSVTISSGTGSLSTALTASEPLLAKFLPMAHVVSSAGTQFHYLPDRTQLNFTRSGLVPYYVNDNGTLRTRNTDNSLTSLSTTLTVTAQYVPTIGDIPSQLEEMYLDVLEQMVKGRMNVSQNSPEAQANA